MEALFYLSRSIIQNPVYSKVQQQRFDNHKRVITQLRQRSQPSLCLTQSNNLNTNTKRNNLASANSHTHTHSHSHLNTNHHVNNNNYHYTQLDHINIDSPKYLKNIQKYKSAHLSVSRIFDDKINQNKSLYRRLVSIQEKAGKSHTNASRVVKHKNKSKSKSKFKVKLQQKDRVNLKSQGVQMQQVRMSEDQKSQNIAPSVSNSKSGCKMINKLSSNSNMSSYKSAQHEDQRKKIEYENYKIYNKIQEIKKNKLTLFKLKKQIKQHDKLVNHVKKLRN